MNGQQVQAEGATGRQTFQASDLFSVSDAHHDALTYLFYDATPRNGHFVLNGAVQHDGDGQLFGVSAANLPNLTFVAGQTGSDTRKIGTTDGPAFSGWTELTVNSPFQSLSGTDALWHQFG
jgi:hypothetical protein